MPRFLRLECHPNFERHQADAGRPVVTCREAQEVWENGFDYYENPGDHPSEYLIVGLTDYERLVTVAIRRLPTTGFWQAYTGWDTEETDW